MSGLLGCKIILSNNFEKFDKIVYNKSEVITLVKLRFVVSKI